MDGIPITTPDGQTQLDHIPLPQIGAIEVLRGLSSGLYGNASGGVISLQSAPIISTANMAVTLGDFQLQSLTATWSSAQEKNLFRTIVTHQKQGGYRQWSAYENTLLSLSNETDFNSGNSLKVDYSFFNSPFANDPGGLTLEQVSQNPKQAREANLIYTAGEQYSNTKSALVSKLKIGFLTHFTHVEH